MHDSATSLFLSILSVLHCGLCNVYFSLRRRVDDSTLAVTSEVSLKYDYQFPFEYKYFVVVGDKEPDCFEHLTHLGGGSVNRCVAHENYLVQGKEGRMYMLAYE